MRVELDGETALVTGGTRNIGLAVASALGRAGARVAVVGRSDGEALDAALAELGPDVMGRLLDVADEAAVVGLFDDVEAKLGAVSILVNGAASRPHEPLLGISRASFTSVLETVLTGSFLTAREMSRRLPAGRRGAIVNLGGLSAHLPSKDRVHVITAKAGLIGLTRALAEEGKGRIRANAVVPGRIDTERRAGQSNPNAGEPKGSLGSVEDVARAVVSLCDPRDVYVTGQTLHVSGGRFMP